MITGAVPLPGARCPRCHRRAPRADGIPCQLCAPGDTSPEAAALRHARRVEVIAIQNDSLEVALRSAIDAYADRVKP
jgi:hypothetical protein